MFHKFLKYISQSISGMIGVSVYILADTFFISYKCGADGLAALNLILPVFGLVFAIGSMIGIGSATRYNISTAKGSPSDYYFTQSIFWCLICSIPFMLTGIFIPHKALALLGADAGSSGLDVIICVSSCSLPRFLCQTIPSRHLRGMTMRPLSP